MGRELKRVPLDFAWPLKKTWKGYLNPNPYAGNCASCDATGYNPATRKLADDFYDNDGCPVRWRYDYGFNPEGKPAERPPWKIIGDCRRWCSSITQDEVQALVDAGRLYDFTHTWTGKRWERREDGYVPTADEVNQWNEQGMGHDGINRHYLIEARAKRLGVYGKCEACDGTGERWECEQERLDYEAWQRYDPPTGDGYQLWETTSEGSPVSPVFESLEDLCSWCADNATTFGSNKATWLQWFEMLSDGLVYHKEGNAVFI